MYKFTYERWVKDREQTLRKVVETSEYDLRMVLYTLRVIRQYPIHLGKRIRLKRLGKGHWAELSEFTEMSGLMAIFRTIRIEEIKE